MIDLEGEFALKSGQTATDDNLLISTKKKKLYQSKSTSLPSLKLSNAEKDASNFHECGTAEIVLSDFNNIESNTDSSYVDGKKLRKRDTDEIFLKCRQRMHDGRQRAAQSAVILKQTERSIRNQVGLIRAKNTESYPKQLDRSLSTGLLETNLDTWKSHEVIWETNLDDIFNDHSIHALTAKKKAELILRHTRQKRERAKSVDCLMDVVHRTAIDPPENKLVQRKSNIDLRIQQSLERLDIPHWFRKSISVKQRLTANKIQQPVSKSEITQLIREVKSGENKSSMVLISPYGWNLSGLCYNGTNHGRISSTRLIQPYLGWRSMDKLVETTPYYKYKSVTERLSSRPGYYQIRFGGEPNDFRTNKIKSKPKNLPEKVKHKLEKKIAWIETSFVGARPPPKVHDGIFRNQ